MDMEEMASLFEAIKILPLRPTDSIVIKCAKRISNEQSVFMRDILEKIFPGQKIIILDDGMDIEIIRPE